MANTAAFDNNPEAYDLWFTENSNLYKAELEAVEFFLPAAGKGVEIGVGTGRFAAPLGIRLGVEPSSGMASIARQRGIEVVKGIAEALPFAGRSFDFVLMVTIDGFLDDLLQAIGEAGRILKSRGVLIIGMLDRASGPGNACSRKKKQGRFLRQAKFHSVAEMERYLAKAGFGGFAYRQTLFSGENTRQKVEEGHGSGGFAVIRALKGGEADDS
jgi:SAM-dependent methyltransferase